MTWILPKQLHTLASALATEALISDSSEQSQICAQSLLVRSKVSPSRTWSQKWKRDCWTRHLSGRILKPSLGKRFATEWTSSLAAIPASPSAQPASGLERTTQDTSGLGSQMELSLCDPTFASLKTSRDTFHWDLRTCCATFKELVTQARSEYSARVKSAPRTSANDFSSWPTARARDWKDTGDLSQVEYGMTLPRAAQSWATPDTARRGAGPSQLERHTPPLQTQVGMWPTPTTAEAGKIANQPNYGQTGLSNHPAIVGEPKRDPLNKSGRLAQASPSSDGSRQGSWATPIVGDSHLALTPEVAAKRLEEGKVTLSRQNAGKLNPRWVETLMGLPVGWTMPSCVSPATIAPTSFDCSATESSQPPQNERSTS